MHSIFTYMCDVGAGAVRSAVVGVLEDRDLCLNTPSNAIIEGISEEAYRCENC